MTYAYHHSKNIYTSHLSYVYLFISLPPLTTVHAAVAFFPSLFALIKCQICLAQFNHNTISSSFSYSYSYSAPDSLLKRHSTTLKDT